MGGRPGTVTERLFRHISPEPNTGCWLWTASLDDKGYGQINAGNGAIRKAYTVSYELHKGKVPDGLELDHKCRVRCCCNPDHLEPVTHAVNIERRINPRGKDHHLARRTHCKHGHEFTIQNTLYHPTDGRSCRACRRAATKRSNEKRRFK